MKSYLLVSLLLMLILPNLFAGIRNGYEREIPRLKFSLQYLNNLLATAKLSNPERNKIRRKIRFMQNTLAYSKVTDILLRNFRSIAPDVYHEIDSLKDAKGRTVDVYVKFIPKERAHHHSYGLVSFEPSATDGDGCSSEYGAQTVSVVVWLMNSSLTILSHEFGHLNYIIPNLKAYVNYYKAAYSMKPNLATSLGHRCDDAGGRSAYRFERRFKQHYGQYLKQDSTSFISPYAILMPLKRTIRKGLEPKGWEFVTTFTE